MRVAERVSRLRWWASSLALLAGCANGGDEPASACAAQYRLAGGEACDIREAECQGQVLGAVSCVRGDVAEPAELRVIDEATYAKELEPEDDAGQAEQSTVDTWSVALSLLGLLPGGVESDAAAAADSLDNTAAYYSRFYGDVTVVDRGSELDSPDAVALLAHELAHALQDEVSGSSELYERTARTTDAAFALQALGEGEATLVSDLAYAALFDLEEDALYLEQTYDRGMRWHRNYALQIEAPFAALHWLVYDMGASYLLRVRRAGGTAAISELWDQPPLTTVRWMAGPGAVPEGTLRWEEPFDCAAPVDPDGHSREWFDALGALTLQLVLGLHDGLELRSGAPAWERALAWRGDRFRVYANEESGAVAVAWQIRLADAAAVQEVADALERLEAPSALHLEPRELTLLVGQDEATVEAWSRAWSCDPPEREE